MLEGGDAVLTNGLWLYYTTQVTQNALVMQITAIASDRPGGIGIKTETVTF